MGSHSSVAPNTTNSCLFRKLCPVISWTIVPNFCLGRLTNLKLFTDCGNGNQCFVCLQNDSGGRSFHHIGPQTISGFTEILLPCHLVWLRGVWFNRLTRLGCLHCQCISIVISQIQRVVVLVRLNPPYFESVTYVCPPF